MRRMLSAALLVLPSLALAGTTAQYRSSVVIYDTNTDKTQYLNCDINFGVSGVSAKTARYVLDCPDHPQVTLNVGPRPFAVFYHNGSNLNFPMTVLKADENWVRFSFGNFIVKFYPPKE